VPFVAEIFQILKEKIIATKGMKGYELRVDFINEIIRYEKKEKFKT